MLSPYNNPTVFLSYLCTLKTNLLEHNNTIQYFLKVPENKNKEFFNENEIR